MDMLCASVEPPVCPTPYTTESSGTSSVTVSANINKTNPYNDTLNCKMCFKQFSTLQESIRHDLLDHNLAKKRSRRPLHNKLNMILKSISEDDKQSSRKSLHEKLSKCSPGTELAAVFVSYHLKHENLELIYARILGCLEREFRPIGTFVFHPFGSIINGLALKDSDIDLYVEDINSQSPSQGLLFSSRCDSLERTPLIRNTFNQMNFLLHRSPNFSDVISIRKARVPIIKCKHRLTGFSIDINLTCASSVHNTNFVRDIALLDKRLHELMLFLKIWAKQLQLIGRGNMTSYCLITLVIFYLQQPHTIIPAPLASVRTLQQLIPPVIIHGINYAHNLKTDTFILRQSCTTSMLIKDFFNFYKEFDFEHHIIAPFLGTSIPLELFKSEKYQYSEYETQQRVIAELSDIPPKPLQTDRCMCVQDPFCLNHNIAKSMSPPNLDYFRKCMHYAQRVCTDSDISTDAQLYEVLLYGIIEQIVRSTDLYNNFGQCASSNHRNALTYRFSPSRAEMRALIAFSKSNDNEKIYRLWSQQYIDAIADIITKIYLIDMQLASPQQGNKNQRMNDMNYARTWLLSGSIDMWTGRLHMRNNCVSFMEYQFAQTNGFYQGRRQSAAYAVRLSGYLTISTVCNYRAIDVVVSERATTVTGLCKKDPLRKWFTMFKCSMQNFNLKERLQTSGLSCTADTKHILQT